ncbi:MAG TPA: CDP-diacylglycerol--serine O-phosphatidyltransferase [bacterium]|nr:CDP-diacylglycerol--serine O-phosphatidyltransferase [bacterium]
MQLKKSINLVPSLFTTGGLFFAFFSIVRSINGDHHTAAWAILFASLCDAIDGRIARMTKTQSDFGKEYDSLVDLSSFGMAPAILMYTWTLSGFRPVGWFLSFLFFACAALRLARFNVQTAPERQDKKEKKLKFSGLPTPGAACLLATFVLFHEAVLGTESPVKSIAALVMVPLLAVLMVSSVRYRSFKEYNIQRNNYFYILIGAAIMIGIIAIDPNIVLFGGFMVYALSGPALWLLQLRQPRAERVSERGERTKTKGRRFTVIPMNGNDGEARREDYEQRS